MKRLPIKMARDLCNQYGLEQVVILCRDNDGVQHIVTAGNNRQNCKEAGLSGDMLKKVLAWPEETLSKYTQHIRETRAGEAAGT